jgi:hypothetical protein
VRENSLSGNSVERNLGESSPGGANQLSPALQRGVGWEKSVKSRRDDPDLTHTLQACRNGQETCGLQPLTYFEDSPG